MLTNRCRARNFYTSYIAYLSFYEIVSVLLQPSILLIYFCVFLFHLLLNNANCNIWYHIFPGLSKLWGGGGGRGSRPPVPAPSCPPLLATNRNQQNGWLISFIMILMKLIVFRCRLTILFVHMTF